MIPTRKRRAFLLALFHAADAAATVGPIAFIEAGWDRMDIPDGVRRSIPVIKAAASLGLVLGLASPRLGRFTARCLVAYFVVAVGFHVRARDTAVDTAPAFAMGLISALVAGDFARDIATEPSARAVRTIERQAVARSDS